MTIVAAMTGQMLNLAAVARDVKISEPTAKNRTGSLPLKGKHKIIPLSFV